MWHKAQSSEVKPDLSYWDNLMVGLGLAVLIVSLRLFRLMFRNSVRKEKL